jgi:acyl-CoA dehydrogenase
VIVPELPAEIAELKRQIGDFIKAEVYPVELKIAERNAIDTAEVDALRAKARSAGFSMLNMPKELGGRDLSMLAQVALEEESGKATNGLGFCVVDRGPRELLELLTPEQVEKYVMPIVRGEYREAWALTEPGAGSDLAALAATADRDGDDWVINGEKWFVTSEGDAGIYLVAAVHEGEQLLFLVEPGTPGMEITKTPRFLHDPYLDHHPEIVFTNCRIPAENQVSGGDSGSREWILVERLFIAARCCGAALRLLDEATAWAQEREAFGGPIFENQGVSFPLADSLTELHAARLLTYHAAHAFDTLEDRKVVHGKVAMAKLYSSEMAGRVADRAVQIFGGRGYMHEYAAARFFREVRVDRLWEGTSEIQKLIIARGLQKRGAAPYLGWE